MKRYVTLIAIALFLLMMGMNKPSIHAEMSSVELLKEDKKTCENMSSTQKDNWETIMHFLKPDGADIEEMKNHLNQEVLTSQEQLQAELDLETFVKCPDIEGNNYILSEKMAVYHELLAYINQIMDEDDSLEIEGLTLKNFHNDTLMKYIEASFKDGKTVEIKLFSSPGAPADRYFYESEELERYANEIPDWMQFLYTQVITPISKIIDNPLEKSADLYANRKEANKEKAVENKIEEIEESSRFLDADFALTEETHKVWEKPFRSQNLHINSRTYSMLERWEEVHEVDDTYIFPKESIQKRDWESVVEAAMKLDSDIEYDLFQYIFLNTTHKDVDVERLVEEVQREED